MSANPDKKAATLAALAVTAAICVAAGKDGAQALKEVQALIAAVRQLP